MKRFTITLLPIGETGSYHDIVYEAEEMVVEHWESVASLVFKVGGEIVGQVNKGRVGAWSGIEIPSET